MRSRKRRTTQAREIISFWSLILAVSIVCAGLAFLAGKYWVGGLIAKAPTTTAPRVSVKAPSDAAAEPTGQSEPPPKAVVKMEQRAPTDAERSEVEQKYPQDGASLHGATGTDTPDASTGSDTQPIEGDAGSYQVVAGSYKNEANAQRQVDELSSKGFAATIVELNRDGGVYHRVVVGTFDTRDDAQPLLKQVTDAGISANIRPK